MRRSRSDFLGPAGIGALCEARSKRWTAITGGPIGKWKDGSCRRAGAGNASSACARHRAQAPPRCMLVALGRAPAMESSTHSLRDLFEQLGLPAGVADIERFVAMHRPLAAGIDLADAPFWTVAQAQLLREEAEDDADWAEVVDQLNLLLRA
jgi:hypothetical protein